MRLHAGRNQSCVDWFMLLWLYSDKGKWVNPFTWPHCRFINHNQCKNVHVNALIEKPLGVLAFVVLSIVRRHLYLVLHFFPKEIMLSLVKAIYNPEWLLHVGKAITTGCDPCQRLQFSKQGGEKHKLIKTFVPSNKCLIARLHAVLPQRKGLWSEVKCYTKQL